MKRFRFVRQALGISGIVLAGTASITHAIDCNLIPDCGDVVFGARLWVGPGTPSIARRLHVKDGSSGQVNYIMRLDSPTGSGTGQFIETTLNTQFGGFQDATSTYSFQVRNASNTKLYLGTGGTYDGRIGLGTSTPNAYLHIVPASTGSHVWTANGWRRALKLDANGAGSAIQFVTPNKQFGIGAQDGSGAPLLYFWTTSSDNDQGTSDYRMVLDQNGNVGIGTTTPGERLHVAGTLRVDTSVGIGTSCSPSNKLEVNGTIKAKEVVVTQSSWCDHVFADDYPLMPLDRLAQVIDRDGRLPGIPSAEQVAREGVNVADMQASLLLKVEELTLYVLTLKRANDVLVARVSQLEGHSGSSE